MPWLRLISSLRSPIRRPCTPAFVTVGGRQGQRPPPRDSSISLSRESLGEEAAKPAHPSHHRLTRRPLGSGLGAVDAARTLHSHSQFYTSFEREAGVASATICDIHVGWRNEYFSAL